jgi:hypothetical protein
MDVGAADGWPGGAERSAAAVIRRTAVSASRAICLRSALMS